MTQRLIDLKKIRKSVACQTGDASELFINLSKTKHAVLKYSQSYKDHVLAFNINSTKSFILTKPMWKILRSHLDEIDNELNK